MDEPLDQAELSADVAARGMRDMFAAGAVVEFAADIPFRHLLGVNVVVEGMTAITGSLHHIGRKSTPITALTRRRKGVLIEASSYAMHSLSDHLFHLVLGLTCGRTAI